MGIFKDKDKTIRFDKEEMTSLAQVMAKLQNEGFKENFTVKTDNLHALESGGAYKPEEVRIINFYRFEGTSDPADNSILYAIETLSGIRGLLTDAYGPYGDSNVSAFIAKVEEIAKKTNPDEKV